MCYSLDMECIVTGCDRPSSNKHKPGYCSGHKQQMTTYGFSAPRPLGFNREYHQKCEVPSCTRMTKTARLCTPCRKKVNRYGITVDELILLDLHTCQVCGSTDNVYIDHDHVTGKFRGVLCRECNMALGALQDSPALIRRLAEYVEANV